MNFKFSVIIPVYNVEDYLEETINSVLEQSIGFENNIQIVLINDGSPDNSEEICLKYKNKYPNNIIYIKKENGGVSSARNLGLEKATGELCTMLDSDDKWNLNAFEEVYKAYQNHKDISVFSCKMVFFDSKKGNHPLNYKYKKNKIIDIMEEPSFIQLSSSSIFIKTSIAKKYKYQTNIKYSEDNRFVNEILLDEKKYMVLKNPTYYYRRRSSENSAINTSLTNKSWYLVTPKDVYKYLFDLSKKKYGKVIKYIQNLILYDLSWRINYSGQECLTDRERKEYIKLIDELISEIDDDVISENKTMNFEAIIHVLNRKYKTKKYDKLKFEDVYVVIKDKKIFKKSLNLIYIDQTYIRDNKVICYGKLDTKFIPKNDFSILADNIKIPINYYELTNDYNNESYDGEYLQNYVGINFVIDLTRNCKISFNFKEEKMVPRFKKNTLLSDSLKNTYHHIDRKTIYMHNGIIYVKNRNVLNSTLYELKNDIQLIKEKRYKSLAARLVVKIGRIFKHKNIWYISDRVNKADDNGEHFFKYMVDNHPNEKVYYVISKESPDFTRMSKIGKVVDPNSNKYKLVFGLADYVVSSHAENYIYNPMGNGGNYIRDQYNFKFVFLQHGIIKEDLSPWLNVNTKKIDMFVTSTKEEYDSLLKYKYYFGPEVVKLTGLPRFDTLMKKSKKLKVNKTIMLSLTWRNELASIIDKETGQRQYNPDFKNSDYFKYINDIFNDQKLLKVLEEKGYKIRFIPHPNVIVQLSDFKSNKYVDICDADINYQKEFCENAIIVTDYSSVFFDFCYLHKPVIYYQPDFKHFFEQQIYDRGYFDYEKNGFGPVFDNHEEFIKGLIKLVENDAKIEEKYIKRIDKFFTYKDENNCERVYNEIINL